jgi:hypothetical protein
MKHNVDNSAKHSNTMDQDVALGITMTVTQADLAPLRAAGRLGEYAVVYRANRSNLGGGFGDQDRHPLTWAVLVYVDGQAARIYSARGNGREWSSLDRLERWLRDQGYWYWWTRNDIEQIGAAIGPDVEEGDQPADQPEPGLAVPEITAEAHLPPFSPLSTRED